MWNRISFGVNRVKSSSLLVQSIYNSPILNSSAFNNINKYFTQKHLLNLTCGCKTLHTNLLANKKEKYFLSRNNSLTNHATIHSGDRHVERISLQFPDPKHVLNNYYMIVSNELKIQNPLTIQFKFSSAKKGGGGKNEWSCTYITLWPEEIKITSNASTKSEASRKSALKLLCALDKMGKILKNGQPILYDGKTNKEIKKSNIVLKLNEETKIGLHQICDRYNSFIKNAIESTLSAQEETSVYENTSDCVEGIAWTNNHRNDFKMKYKAIETMNLTIRDYREEILKLIEKNRVIIIRGEPGCGKSSYVPQYLLEHCSQEQPNVVPRIVVTQPRRIAAISLAENVAAERNEQAGNVVGYQVRLRSKFNQKTTRIVYCTAGVLLRWLQRDQSLASCSHVVIDEAHERDVNTDLLLYLLRRALDINPQLKLIVMSATVDADLFSEYFRGAPVLHVRGRTFPVKKYYLDEIEQLLNLQLTRTRQLGDNDRCDVAVEEVAEVLHRLHKTVEDGAILCFLPGWDEISKVRRRLTDCPDLRYAAKVLPLHGRLSNEEQRRIFETVPSNVRKIILATNVAETSITVDDVVHVVDTGLHRQHRFDAKDRLSSSLTEWISQSNAEQRAGRAGRVRSGFCYRLYPEERYEIMDEHSTPEMLRTSLDKVLLDAKVFTGGTNTIDLFTNLPSPPTRPIIDAASFKLQQLGLLDENEKVTQLGQLVSQFPMTPGLAKAMIQSVTYKCVTPIVDIATIFGTESSDIFTTSLVNKQLIRETKIANSATSDHIALLLLFERWTLLVEDRKMNEAMDFCNEHHLLGIKLHTLRKLREMHFQYLESCLQNVSNLSDDFADDEEFIKGVLFSGVNNVLSHKGWDIVKGRLKRTDNLITSGGHKATITPESVNNKKIKADSFYIYINEIRSELRRSVLVRETSLMNPLTLLLFYGGEFSRKFDKNDEMVTLKMKNTKIQIRCTESEADLIEECRKVLRQCEEYFIGQYSMRTSRFQPLPQWNTILEILKRILREKSCPPSAIKTQQLENQMQSR